MIGLASTDDTSSAGGGGGGTIIGESLRFFSPDGALSSSPDFEYRRGQEEMAGAVAQALVEAQPLVVEAGTGVGKSLAYLVPAALCALDLRRKAVISTHTINLQEQLVQKDIPILADLLGRPLRAELLKGRGNYVCPNRLSRTMSGSGGGDLFTSSEVVELKELWKWAQTTKDGTLSDLDFNPAPSVWSQVCSEGHACNQKLCPPGSRCFYQDARRRVEEADIVVLNHTLFFTLLAAGGADGDGAVDVEDGGFLFPGDFAIFDEAHTLEGVAARQLGLRLSHSGMRFDLQRLYNPRSRKGLFTVLRDPEGVKETSDLLDQIDHFFGEVEDVCPIHGPAREFRVRQPEIVEDSLAPGLHRVAARAMDLAERCDSETTKLELHDLARRATAARHGVANFLELEQDDHVYWVEKNSRAHHQPLALCSAPVDVGAHLRHMLFAPGRRCVVTSATLGVGDRDLSYFRNRVGADAATPLQVESPFDYRKQMGINLVRAIPEPSSPQFPEELAKWIAHFLDASDGRAFVLFTSYKGMEDAAKRLEDFCLERGWQLFVQGRGLSRARMIKEFKKDKSSVLFGTDSFWTGVDVPGEALSNVIIARLPFAVPDHPLVASQIEKIEAEGGNSFFDYSVPTAIIKLRQGVGRLIRSRKDRGSIAILDNRILTKRYGQSFLKALPHSNVQVHEDRDRNDFL